MFRRYLQNPIVLRDLGWEYYPPVLRRFPRRKFQMWVGGGLVLLFPIGAGLMELRISDGGAPTLAAVAMIGLVAILVRSLISGPMTWSRDRDFAMVEELILTGMRADEIAAAKVFARGFVFVVGSIVLALYGIAAFVWAQGIEWRDFLAFSGIVLWLPPMITNLYLRQMRIATRRGWFLGRVLASALWWMLVVPALAFCMFAVLLAISSFLRIEDSESQWIVVLSIWVALGGWWAMVLASYRALVHDVRVNFLSISDDDT